MSFKKYLQHILILTYLGVTAAAMLYTLFRIETPVPWPVTRYFYGMMAPYQRYRTINEEMKAEGLTERGEWVKIPLEPYLPFLRGEQALRAYFVSFRVLYGDEERFRQYRLYAEKLREREAAAGRNFVEVRLFLIEWPMSPAGFDFLKQEPFLTSTPLATYP